MSGLAKQRQDRLRRLVGLREHARAGLLQDLRLRELHHLLGHVHVADARLGGDEVLLVGAQVSETVLQTVLHGAKVGALGGDLLDRRVDVVQRQGRGVGVERPSSAVSISSSVRAVKPASDAVVALATTSAMPVPPTRSLVVIAIDSLSLAPTWRLTVPAPLSSWVPLNFVLALIVPISVASWATSARIAVLSVAFSVSLPYWTRSSRTRCSIEWTSVSAPSPVCTSETPSCALR